ncbi:hypothetical protein DTO282F9_930 [Paecilomyces variotii]|nr:hypothetical protein DTO282F9_930 [Paecilomyces variotii]
MGQVGRHRLLPYLLRCKGCSVTQQREKARSADSSSAGIMSFGLTEGWPVSVDSRHEVPTQSGKFHQFHVDKDCKSLTSRAASKGRSYYCLARLDYD